MKNHILKAHEIRESGVRRYREHKQELLDAMRVINNDTMLSTEGHAAKRYEKRKQFAGKLIGLASEIKAEITAELDQARKKAQKVLDVDVAKPDDKTLSKFERSLADVKTSVLLSPGADRAYETLRSFVDGLDDAYLADLTARQYPELIATITAKGNVSTDVINGLRELHDGLTERFKTDEQREAAQVIARADELEQLPIFGLAVQQDVHGVYGKGVVPAVMFPDGVNIDELDVIKGRSSIDGPSI